MELNVVPFEFELNYEYKRNCFFVKVCFSLVKIAYKLQKCQISIDNFAQAYTQSRYISIYILHANETKSY